jgi:hypothetical protein
MVLKVGDIVEPVPEDMNTRRMWYLESLIKGKITKVEEKQYVIKILEGFLIFNDRTRNLYPHDTHVTPRIDKGRLQLIGTKEFKVWF